MYMYMFCSVLFCSVLCCAVLCCAVMFIWTYISFYISSICTFYPSIYTFTLIPFSLYTFRQTALNYVFDNLLSNEEKSKVIVYGQSIGGAVAISLAHANPTKIRTLIVENTFLSIPALIPAVAPILKPFACLCTERWNSAALIPQLRQKCLFLSGLKDELIPPEQMTKLHQSARSALIKRIVHFPKGMHNDTCIQPGYFEAIEEFLNAKFVTPRVQVEEITDEEKDFRDWNTKRRINCPFNKNTFTFYFAILLLCL